MFLMNLAIENISVKKSCLRAARSVWNHPKTDRLFKKLTMVNIHFPDHFQELIDGFTCRGLL
jgi:hypothetical protein